MVKDFAAATFGMFEGLPKILSSAINDNELEIRKEKLTSELKIKFLNNYH
jgi:hypothetical protein